jgi:hypothetical protein
MNATCKVFVPCFMSWYERSQKCSICTLSLRFCAQMYYTDAPCAGDNKRSLVNVQFCHTMPQMSQVLRERAIGMLAAGMSTRSVDVHFSSISRLQRHFWEFDSTSNQPQNLKTSKSVSTPAQDPTSGFFTCRVILDQPPGQMMKLRSIQFNSIQGLYWHGKHVLTLPKQVR